MHKLKFIILIFIIFCFVTVSSSFSEDNLGREASRGVWVSVFSKDKVLYSRDAVMKLVASCKQAKINQIYLQVYQSGRAYYDSRITNPSRYEDMVKSAGVDTIDFLLKEARANNIKVFAWVNLLSLGQNDQADIIKKFGEGVLTKDQHNRTTGRSNPDELDKYYLRDELLFLEPGDQRVTRYLVSIVEEIIERYPLFSGVHLDYIRYPTTVPFIPGSRFTKYGLSYGYGLKNIERFREWAGLDPLVGLKSANDYMLWDNWRRDQVTSLVRRIAKRIKEKSPSLLVSAAVIPAGERAYSSMFQDWPFWLEEGLVDYVVLMNYTLDNRLTKELVRSALSYRGNGRVFIGIGLFLMKDTPNAFIEQYKTVAGLSPDGIVIYSYDDMDDKFVEGLNKL